jgi:hypothetical protein
MRSPLLIEGTNAYTIKVDQSYVFCLYLHSDPVAPSQPRKKWTMLHFPTQQFTVSEEEEGRVGEEIMTEEDIDQLHESEGSMGEIVADNNPIYLHLLLTDGMTLKERCSDSASTTRASTRLAYMLIVNAIPLSHNLIFFLPAVPPCKLWKAYLYSQAKQEKRC